VEALVAGVVVVVAIVVGEEVDVRSG